MHLDFNKDYRISGEVPKFIRLLGWKVYDWLSSLRLPFDQLRLILCHFYENLLNSYMNRTVNFPWMGSHICCCSCLKCHKAMWKGSLKGQSNLEFSLMLSVLLDFIMISLGN